MSSRRVRVTVAAVVAALALAALWAPARANGVPTLVRLAYIDGLSNWGPTDAFGTAELGLSEGYVKIDATGLPQLDRQRYQGWIVNSQTNDAISVGTFNASDARAVAYRGTLPEITDFGFDLFILTVEPDPDDAPQPTAQRSIGGRFSLAGARSAGGVGGDSLAGGPRQLPNTGDPTYRADLLRLAALVAAIAVSLGVGLRLGRSHA